MTPPTINLDLVQIASPCPADWDKMAGDDRVRFCRQCNLHVYNLSGMSRAEAETLVSHAEGRTCIRFYRRTDGTLLTRDCPVGLRAVRQRFVRAVAALAGMVVALVTGTLFGGRLRNVDTGLSSPASTYAEWIEPGSTRQAYPMGILCVPPPLTPPPVPVPGDISILEPAESPLPQPTPQQLQEIAERLE
jgi:hypothetical protein